jgi:hypothetical protein
MSTAKAAEAEAYYGQKADCYFLKKNGEWG